MSVPSAPTEMTLHVGEPPNGFVHPVRSTSVSVVVNNFPNLNLNGDHVESPAFDALGHRLAVRIRPDTEYESTARVANKSQTEVELRYNVGLIGNASELVDRGWSSWGKIQPDSTGQAIDLGSRSRLDRLANKREGALIVKVTLWIKSRDTAAHTTSFIPSNPILGNLIKEFDNETTADVKFEVGAREIETRGDGAKRARRSPTTFHAHYLILRSNAPTLAEMCKPGDTTPAQISNVNPEAFKHLLCYCYGGKISCDDLKEHAKDIIDTADRFGVTGLKLEAEAYLVKNEKFALDSIVDSLLYADSKNCALLLEKAMDFVVENRDDVLANISLDNLPSTMMMDLLTAVGSVKKGDSSDDYTYMRVDELRKQLHEKGLCFDGSRKAMIALLKENS
mmetsp:Transcript_5419/g.12332  ORF Transcript_5419/g.12332 Transcript_5419/m.12332 type:complete len:394 (-) Transcript_5419:47-1228(-)